MTTKVIQADREAAAAFFKDGSWPNLPLAFASHADPLRRALEKINELSVTPISGDHAAINNGKELIRAKAIARQALGLAALSSGENNNGE